LMIHEAYERIYKAVRRASIRTINSLVNYTILDSRGLRLFGSNTNIQTVMPCSIMSVEALRIIPGFIPEMLGYRFENKYICANFVIPRSFNLNSTQAYLKWNVITESINGIGNNVLWNVTTRTGTASGNQYGVASTTVGISTVIAGTQNIFITETFDLTSTNYLLDTSLMVQISRTGGTGDRVFINSIWLELSADSIGSIDTNLTK